MLVICENIIIENDDAGEGIIQIYEKSQTT